MNLQESIRRILKEETKLPSFIRRRYSEEDIDELISNVKTSIPKYDDDKNIDDVIYDEVREFMMDKSDFGYHGTLRNDLTGNEYYLQLYKFEEPLRDYVKSVILNTNLQESIRRVLREEINNETFNPHNENYLDAWLGVGDEDMESYEDYGINTIGRIIDEVKELKFPLRIYRGINTLDKQGKHNLVDDLKYDNVSWSTSRYVSEKFGNIVYTGIVDSIDDIDLDYTIYRRILHKPLDENEIVMKDNRLIKNLKRFK